MEKMQLSKEISFLERCQIEQRKEIVHRATYINHANRARACSGRYVGETELESEPTKLLVLNTYAAFGL